MKGLLFFEKINFFHSSVVYPSNYKMRMEHKYLLFKHSEIIDLLKIAVYSQISFLILKDPDHLGYYPLIYLIFLRLRFVEIF